MRRALATLVLATIPLTTLGAPNVSGIWGIESWNCGGNTCTSLDIRTGNATRVLSSLKLIVFGNTVCGTWHSDGGRAYWGFVRGEVTSVGAFVALGQEMEHNASAYGAQSLAQLPTFIADEHATLSLIGGKLLIAYTSGGSKNGTTEVVGRLSTEQITYFGLESPGPWEAEFLEACRREA